MLTFAAVVRAAQTSSGTHLVSRVGDMFFKPAAYRFVDVGVRIPHAFVTQNYMHFVIAKAASGSTDVHPL